MLILWVWTVGQLELCWVEDDVTFHFAFQLFISIVVRGIDWCHSQQEPGSLTFTSWIICPPDSQVLEFVSCLNYQLLRKNTCKNSLFEWNRNHNFSWSWKEINKEKFHIDILNGSQRFRMFISPRTDILSCQRKLPWIRAPQPPDESWRWYNVNWQNKYCYF